MVRLLRKAALLFFWHKRMRVHENRSPMDKNAQRLPSPSATSDHDSIAPATGRGYLIGGSIASRFVKRPFDLRALNGLAWRHPIAVVMRGVVANWRGLRTAAVIAVTFGIIASDTNFAFAGQCTDKVKQIEAALDELTSNPDTSAVHQSLRAQMHRQPNPRSVARGQEQAIADERHHRAALERARAADANHDEAGCMKALPDLRHELIIR